MFVLLPQLLCSRFPPFAFLNAECRMLNRRCMLHAVQPKESLDYHAAQRWLLHLDGQTCSSRLEQLLPLGSLVLKEESGE